MAGPVTVVPGDLLLASLALARGATGAVQPPPGWTEVPGAQAQTPATACGPRRSPRSWATELSRYLVAAKPCVSLGSC